jgi:succinyl-diaminopimelate desuccinylase
MVFIGRSGGRIGGASRVQDGWGRAGGTMGRVDLPDFLDAAEDLLAIASTADRPDELNRALDYVIDYVGPGFTVERFESGGKPSALLWPATHETRPEFRIVFNAHLDVVPGDPAQFRPRREGDRLIARGAQDMKVSGLLLADAFKQMAPRVPYPFGLQLVTDEEVGGRNGTYHQVQGGVRSEFVVIGEHSGLDLVADSKGLLHAILRAKGRSGHGAYPWLGDNAIMKLVRALNRLEARYPTPSQAQWRTTVNVARVDTPNRAVNQIPAYAEASLDIRFPAEDASIHGRSVEELTAYLSSFGGGEPGVDVVVEHVDGPHHADHDRAEVKLLRQAAQAQGYAGEFLYKHGAGDGRFYSQRGMESVVFGVGGDGQHGPDEYADITTFEPYHRALLEFLGRL